MEGKVSAERAFEGNLTAVGTPLHVTPLHVTPRFASRRRCRGGRLEPDFGAVPEKLNDSL